MALNNTYFETKGRDVTVPIPDTPGYIPPIPPTPPTPGSGSEPVIPRPSHNGTVSVTFYKNNSDYNCVNKSLTSITSATLSVKDDLDLINPSFLIEGLNSSLPSDGLYMEMQGRYYFCKYTCLPGNLLKIDGHVDVLMSHKAGIKSNSAIIARNASNINPYIKDNEQVVTSYNTVHTLPFSGSFSKTLNYYLLAIGE